MQPVIKRSCQELLYGFLAYEKPTMSQELYQYLDHIERQGGWGGGVGGGVLVPLFPGNKTMVPLLSRYQKFV